MLWVGSRGGTQRGERTLSGFNQHVCKQGKDLHRRRDCLVLLLLGCCPGPRPDARIQVQPLALHLLRMQRLRWECASFRLHPRDAQVVQHLHCMQSAENKKVWLKIQIQLYSISE